jgi:hypothetical protein
VPLRSPITGRFISAAAAKAVPKRRDIESCLRAKRGSPPRGKSWFAIAGRYPERFEDFLADTDE